MHGIRTKDYLLKRAGRMVRQDDGERRGPKRVRSLFIAMLLTMVQPRMSRGLRG